MPRKSSLAAHLSNHVKRTVTGPMWHGAALEAVGFDNPLNLLNRSCVAIRHFMAAAQVGLDR